MATQSIQSRLKAIKPDKVAPGKIKMLVSGKPSVGKTWVAMDFPNVYFIDVEGGAKEPHYLDKLAASGGVYLGQEQGAMAFSDVLEQLQSLATEKHNYKTAVIDSITKLYLTEQAREAERLIRAGYDTSYGKDRKTATAYMRRMISWIARIDMNVILIAHSKDEWGKNDKGDREVVGETFDGWDKLEYEMNLWLQVFRAGPRRIARVKKTRLAEFPEAMTFDWTYDQFAERYHRNVIEAPTKPIVLPTEEQIAEFNRLSSIFIISEKQREKWLSAADVSTFEEMDAEKLTKCINYMKGLISKETLVTKETTAAEYLKRVEQDKEKWEQSISKSDQ